METGTVLDKEVDEQEHLRSSFNPTYFM